MRRDISICMIVLVLAAGAAIGADNKESVTPPLVPSEFIWVFGIIPPNAKVSHHYALTNPHKDTITIVEMRSDCDCTTVPKAPVKVAPGETYLLKVEFDTRTYYGETNRDITITTDFDPLPKMILYFSSIASQMPKSIRISPSMTAFIPGKNEQTFTITNMSDYKTTFTLRVDHDSTLKVSETNFSLGTKESQEITIMPIWDRVTPGYNSSCVVVEFTRDETYHVSIPIKLNKF